MTHPLPETVRAIVLQKTEGRCAYCGCSLAQFTYWHAEHSIPKSRGGSDELDNLVPSCPRCNSYKSTKTPRELADYVKDETIADIGRAIERLDHFSANLSVVGGTIRGLKSKLGVAILEIDTALVVDFEMPGLAERDIER
jgi:hypothetical protein